MNLIRDLRKFYLIFFFLTFLPAFPARAATGAPTVQINGASYLQLDLFSKQEGYQYDWDPLLRNAVVKGPLDFVKFHVGSPYILTGGRVLKLNGAVRFFNGAAAAPSSAVAYLEGLGQPKVQEMPATMKAGTPAPYHQVRRIVIDAGHGGQDYGAISPQGTIEKELVLDVAKGVAEELRARGIEPLLTREEDVFVPLGERAEFTNQKHADLFVSIHANASRSRSLQGFEVYYLSSEANDLAIAARRARNSQLDTILWDLREEENRRQSIGMASAIAGSVRESVEISAERLRSAQFYVLKWAECPAVLVEIGYVTNGKDERLLNSPIYRSQLAQAIAEGLLRFKSEFEKTNGFTE